MILATYHIYKSALRMRILVINPSLYCLTIDQYFLLLVRNVAKKG